MKNFKNYKNKGNKKTNVRVKESVQKITETFDGVEYEVKFKCREAFYSSAR